MKEIFDILYHLMLSTLVSLGYENGNRLTLCYKWNNSTSWKSMNKTFQLNVQKEVCNIIVSRNCMAEGRRNISLSNDAYENFVLNVNVQL